MSLVEREHAKRLEKLVTERFFLLEAQNKPDSLSFGVSGSTGNVYTVEVNIETRRLKCNCPDASSHAQRFGVECKHCLFVAHRALRSSLPNNHFTTNGRRIPSALLAEWSVKTDQLQALFGAGEAATATSSLKGDKGEEIINLDYTRRYQQASTGEKEKGKEAISTSSTTSSTASTTSPLPPGVVLTCDFNGRGADEECPICFEPIVDEKQPKRELVQCQTCTRAIHLDCAQQWITTGRNETCVYCRSILLYATFREAQGGSSLKKRKTAVTSSAYINVAQTQ